MRIIKKLFGNLHRYVVVLLLSVVIWAWIFSLVTDAAKAKKVLVYCGAPAMEERALGLALDAKKPEGIKFVKVSPFSDAIFSSGAPDDADIYILSESQVRLYSEELLPLDEKRSEGDIAIGGVVYGILLRSAETGNGSAASFITYSLPGFEDENYYICFNKDSVHVNNGEGSDGAAFEVAESLLSLY